MNNVGGVTIKNEGKKFEEDFKNSLPDYCWYKRLNDNAAAFSGGTNTRFASNNECDYILFNTHRQKLFALELKSSKSSITFWKQEFSDDGKKHSFQIKKNQIIGLKKWSEFNNILCGFVFNFRNEHNSTYFVDINSFIDYILSSPKRSININDVKKMNCVEIYNKKKRTRYRYDIDNFLSNVN